MSVLIAAIFTAHLLVVHGSIIAHWVFQPLHGLGYQLWSGIASDVGEVTLVGGTLALLKHANCDAPRCLRYGPHRTADGHHRLCRKHHPDMPNRRLSLKEIHERHHKAQIEREPVTSV